MIICADDYGFSKGVNEAIHDLVRIKKVNAVSVLINKVDAADVCELKKLSSQIKIGLHVDLGLIKPQIELFYKFFGFYPNYYDGHRHVHIYPIISHSLIKNIKRLPEHDFYIRSLGFKSELKPTGNLLNILYFALLAACNRYFVKQLKRNNISTNEYIYGAFNNHMDIRKIFEIYKRHHKENDIFFFHPSAGSENCKIPRLQEYEYFKNK